MLIALIIDRVNYYIEGLVIQQPNKQPRPQSFSVSSYLQEIFK